MKKIFLTLLSTVWVLNGNASAPGSLPKSEIASKRSAPTQWSQNANKKIKKISEKDALNSGSLIRKERTKSPSISSTPYISSPSYIQYMQSLAKKVLGNSNQLANEMEIEKIEDIVKLTIEKAKDKNAKAKEIADQGLYPWKRELLNLDLELKTQMYALDNSLKSLKKTLETLEIQKFIKSEKHQEIKELNDKIRTFEEAYNQTRKSADSVEEIMVWIEKGLNMTRKYYFNQEKEKFASSIIEKMKDMSPEDMSSEDFSAFVSTMNQMANSYVPSYSSPNQNARVNSGISKR